MEQCVALILTGRSLHRVPHLTGTPTQLRLVGSEHETDIL